MSAYVVVQQPDAVHVLTDGLSYAPDGVVREITEKCFQLGSMPAAVTSRGPAGLQKIIAEIAEIACSDGASFDVFLDYFPSLMEGVNKAMTHDGKAPEFDIIMAGWSALRDRLVVYSWENHERYRTEAAPYELVEITAPILMAPVPSDPDLLAAGWNPALQWNAFEPERDGLIIMEAQRRFKSTERDQVDPGLFFVGGRVTLTTVTRQGVMQKPLKQFADTIGQKIRPELNAVAGSHQTSCVNRHERRAMARRDRSRRASA